MDDSDPKYTAACSCKTIQSEKQGFFREFFDEVVDTCGTKWIKDRFSKLKTDQERVLSLFNDPQICDPVLGVLEHVKPVFKEKDATFSSQRRLQGERCILTGDYKKALMLLNQAVLRAPPKGVDKIIDDGISLALAFWSRSNVLLELGEGQMALNDMKLATLHGLTNLKQNPEFYWKTTKAYAIMGEMAKAKISLGLTENFLYGNETKIQKCRREFENITISNKNTTKPKVPNVSGGGENPNLKGASNLIQLSSAPGMGNFIVAKDNVKVGDIVLVEEPVAACLLPSFFGSHCHHCFERLFAPVGCPNCSGIAFCTQECMMAACTTYHKYECKYLDLLIGSGMSVLCWIALRIFTQTQSMDDAIRISNELISNLCTHATLRSADDFLHRTLMTAFLVRFLQKSEYFGRRTTEAVDPTGKELEVATLLLGLLQLLQFNAHEIYSTMTTDEHRFDGSKLVYVGAGIYKTGSYFNHDCCPGLARYFVGKSIVLACTRPVNSGEPVSENYGPICTKNDFKDRQKTLRSRYWFHCNCDACKENWPTLQKLDKNVRFRCITPSCDNTLKFPKEFGKDVRCSRCRKTISLKESIISIIKCEEIYRQAAALMKEQNSKGAIELFKEGIDLFHQFAVLPHKDTLIAQESLRSCFADSGTTFKILN